MSVIAPQYSALCDTDLHAYSQYSHAYSQYLTGFCAAVFRDVYCHGKSDSLLASGKGIYDSIMGTDGGSGTGNWKELCDALGGLARERAHGTGGHLRTGLDAGSGGPGGVDDQDRADVGGSFGCSSVDGARVVGGERRADDGCGDASCVSSDERAPAGVVGHVGVADGSPGLVRGKNWRKNLLRRENKKKRSAAFESRDLDWRKKNATADVHVGVFADCEKEVRDELRNTRAKMLVAKNKLEEKKAEASLRRVEAVRKARIDELEFETNRLKMEEERRALVKTVLASLPVGYAETLASVGVESDVPSLADRSISPSSSISMAEVQAMRKEIADLKERVASDYAEYTEEKVHLRARINLMQDEKNEALAAEKKKREQLSSGYESLYGECSLEKLRIHDGKGYSSWSC